MFKKNPGRKTIRNVALALTVMVMLVTACAANLNDVRDACTNAGKNPGETVTIQGTPYVCPSDSSATATTVTSKAAEPKHRAPNMPSMPAGLTSAQQLGYGLIGVLPDGSYQFEGDYWPPTTDALDQCRANPEAQYKVPGDYTADGNDFVAKCSHILAGYSNVGDKTWEELANLAPTAVPPSETPTPAPTNTPLPTATIMPSPTAFIMPTATTVAASTDGVMVYNQVVALCAGGAPYVTVGMVTVPCTGTILPAPTGNTATSGTAGPDTASLSSVCLDNGELFTMEGWGTNGVKAVKDGENVLWETCGKWVVQAVGIGTFNLHMLKGFQYTATLANGIVTVFYGDGQWREVWGSTIRQLSTYTTDAQSWVLDPIRLMAREYNYGFKQNPRYGTVPGNLDLGTSWIQPTLETTCPANQVMAAAILGGDEPSFWTAPKPEEPWGAWKFNSKGYGFHHLTHPGGTGYFDVWTAEHGVVSVYASDTSLFKQKNFEEASYHCPGK